MIHTFYRECAHFTPSYRVKAVLGLNLHEVVSLPKGIDGASQCEFCGFEQGLACEEEIVADSERG